MLLFTDVIVYNLLQYQIMLYQLVIVFSNNAKSFNVLQLKIHNVALLVVIIIHFIIQYLVL